MKRIWFMEVVIAIDRMFNAIAGGRSEITISARLGYLYYKRPSPWATILMRIVDFTFKPVDGNNHCLQAYFLETDEVIIKGNKIALAFLSLFVVLGCVVIYLPILIISLWK